MVILDEEERRTISEMLPGSYGEFSQGPANFDLDAWIIRAGFNPLARTDEALRGHWRAFVDEQDELLLEHQPPFQETLDQQGRLIAAAVERGDDPLVLLATTTLLMEPYAALYEAVMPDYARRTFEAIEDDEGMRSFVKYTFGRKHIDEWHVRQVDDDLLFGWNEAVSDFLRTEGARNVTRINDTTRTWLSGFLAEASDEGWGPVKAAREARRRWPEPGGPASKARIERIVRTELIGASNKGSLLGAQSVGERLGVPMNKTWLAAFVNTRDDHAAAHGQTVAVNESFQVGGSSMDHPGDQGAPAAQIVNCMCTLTFEVAG